jgi:hypothetical protein
MSIAQWISCPSNTFTRIWASPTFGPWLTVWTRGSGTVNVSWNEYSANPPFSISGSTNVGPTGTVGVGPPSPWVELWIMPAVSGDFRAT